MIKTFLLESFDLKVLTSLLQVTKSFVLKVLELLLFCLQTDLLSNEKKLLMNLIVILISYYLASYTKTASLLSIRKTIYG